MKTKVILFLLVLIWFLSLPEASGQSCSNATNLPNVINYCSGNAAYTNVPAPSGTFTAASCWTTNPTQDVWFSFTATQTDVLMSVSGFGSGAGTINNPCIALYIGPCASTLTEIGCSNGTSGTSQLYKGGLVPGTQYLIRVSSTVADKGTFKLCLNNYTPTVNPGADCNGAAYLCNKNPISVAGLSGGGTNTHEPEITSCAMGTVETNSCWYYFTCQTSGTLLFDIIPANITNDIDYILYSLADTNVCGTRTPIRCDYSSCINSNGSTGLNATSPDSSVGSGCNPPQNSYTKQVNLVAGQSYALFINNFSTSSGFTINWGGTSTFLGPTPVITASDTTICAGKSITYNGSNSKNWKELYWNFSSGGSPAADTGAGPFTINYNTPGNYVAILEGVAKGGCTTVASQNIIVLPPPVVTIAVPDTLHCLPAPVTLNASSPASPVTYTWSGPGIASGGNTATPVVNAPGTYTVTATNSIGCAGNTTVDVYYAGPPNLTLSSSNVSCSGGSDGVITANLSAAGPFTYSWSPAGGSAKTASNLGPGNYTVIVTDKNGCSVSDTVTITSPAPLVVNVTETDATCGAANGSAIATVSGGTGAYTYSWNTTPAQHSANANNILQGVYIIMVQDAKGCTKTGTVTVNSIGGSVLVPWHVDDKCNGSSDGTAAVNVSGGTFPYQYSWNTVPVQTTDTATGLKAGVYTITVTTANGCKTSATITITQPAAILLSATVRPEHCGKGDGSVVVNTSGGTGPYTYLWNTVPPQNSANATALHGGNYTVKVTDAKGCTQTLSKTIPNIPGPIALFQFNNACVNAACSFTDSSAGSVSWTWNFGDGTSSLLKDPKHIYNTAGNFQVTLVITDIWGCRDSTSKQITAYPLPIVAFGDSTFGCSPATVTFVNHSSPPGSTYSWNFGDHSSSSQINPVHIYTNSSALTVNTYTVSLTVTSPKGCVDSLKKNNYVTVYPIPVASFTMSREVVDITEPLISFYNLSTGNNFNLWSFGGQDTSSLISPTHTFPDTGRVDVCLNIRNTFGCVDSVCHEVIIKPIWSFYIPNCFTPNGDHLNDAFLGYGANILEYRMMIFDRWGNQVFTGTNLADGWDGRANGGPAIAQEDVYVYVVILKDVFHEEHRYTGTVTLIK